MAASTKIPMKSLLAMVGSDRDLHRITSAFYDKVYAHPWLSQFFAGVEKAHLARMQADFMHGVMGGEHRHHGKSPSNAHHHIRITHEAFDLRQKLLRQTLAEQRVNPIAAARWLEFDEAFRPLLVRDVFLYQRPPGGKPAVRVPSHLLR